MGEFPCKEAIFQSGPKQVEISRRGGLKGGKVKSEKKTLANRINLLRRWGMTDETIIKVTNLIQDSNLSLSDTYKQIENLDKVIGDDPKGQAIIFSMKERWHKLAHGDKSIKGDTNIIAQTLNNVVVNINMIKEDKKNDESDGNDI